MNRWILTLWSALMLLLITSATQAAQPDELLPTSTPTVTATTSPTPSATTTGTPGPTGTPAPTTTPTPPPWDAAEPNNHWSQAREIAVGEPVQKLNFVCPDASGCVDNDFYTVQLKAGICYRIATTELVAGIDTNLIVYGPGKDSAPPLGGNDDVEPGSFGSQVELCLPPGSDPLTSYLLIGQSGNRKPPEPAHTRTYTLTVEVVPPATPTPAPTIAPTAIPSVAPTAAPAPDQAPRPGPGANPTPRASDPPQTAPTPRTPSTAATPPAAQPVPGVTVSELPPASQPQAEQRPQIAVNLGLRACYDRNDNAACDIDEGIGGLTVYVADEDRGTLLGQVLTDSSGTAQITIRADEDAQLSVSVPYFAAVQTVAARSPRLEPIIVTDRAPLPALLP